MALPAKRFVAPDEYLALEEQSEMKHEYLRGEIYAMSGGSLNRNRIAGNFYAALRAALKRKPCEVFGSDMRVLVAESGLYTYPDLSVVCGKPELAPDRDDTITNPLVIVEVLSPATKDYDRGRKFDLYRALRSLQAYVLVDQDQAHVEYFRRLPDGTWELQTHTELTDRFKIHALNVSVSLSALYEKVERRKAIPFKSPVRRAQK